MKSSDDWSLSQDQSVYIGFLHLFFLKGILFVPLEDQIQFCGYCKLFSQTDTFLMGLHK